MNRFGIPVELKYVPSLDPDFMPLLRFNRAFLADAKKPVSIAVERDRGQIAAYHTFIHGTEEAREADCYYMDRLVKTCSPDYYRWGQWIFEKLWERGLVYRKKNPVNWCPKCETVLANEQVIEGRCWRCDSEVEKRDLEQW